MRIGVITLFPEMFRALDYGVVGRAIKDGLINLTFWNPRDYTTDNYCRVDDRPYGGGPGMVMLAQPLFDAVNSARNAQLSSKVLLLTPQGKPLHQKDAIQLSQEQSLILVAGRYEGIDQRLIDSVIDEEWSIGDYVLSGGELAAMVMIDSIVRLLPNVLGDNQSAQQDSFMDGLLDCPHYTRPPTFNGQNVPDVLLSGDHKRIARWRLKQMLGQTYLKRPDLLNQRKLTELEQQLLQEFCQEAKAMGDYQGE